MRHHPASLHLGRAIAALAVMFALTACSDTPSADGDATENAQREGLESAWDKYSDDDRRGLCSAYESDPVGTIGDFEGESFDYDLVRDWLDSKC